MYSRLPYLVLSLCLLTYGCGDKGGSASSNSGGGASAETSARAAAKHYDWDGWDQEVTTEIADWETIETAIESHKGKIVVVDFWATWCEPCLEEFPGLVRLQKMHKEDVVAISVNMNYAGLDDETPEKMKDEALDKLTEFDARIENYVSKQIDEEMFQQANIKQIPTILVFDKTGKRHEELAPDGPVSYSKHVYPVVEELLKK